MTFHDKKPKQTLKTLSNVNKKKKVVRVSLKELILRANKKLFGNMLIIAQGRKLNMREILAHPLGPIPWRLPIKMALCGQQQRADYQTS